MKLSNQLANIALRIKTMPPDGDCFYHAVAQRLSGFGHLYTVAQLKHLAGATDTEEAEESHINILANTPVPLYLRFVPVDIDADKPVLLWDASSSKGEPSSPLLTLVLWTRGWDGGTF